MKDILSAVAKTRRALAKQYPGASDEALEGAIREMVTIALADPKATLEDAMSLFDMAVDAAQDEWTCELSTILLEKVVRPEYDKAIEAEVDPITVVRANCGMSEGKAREVVAKLIGQVATQETLTLLTESGVIPTADCMPDVADADADAEEDVAPGADLGHGTRI